MIQVKLFRGWDLPTLERQVNDYLRHIENTDYRELSTIQMAIEAVEPSNIVMAVFIDDGAPDPALERSDGE